MKAYNRTAEVNSPSNTASLAFNLLLPAEKQKSDLSPVYFIRLKLTDNKGTVLSENFYWKGTEKGNYQALNKLPKAKLAVKSNLRTKDGKSIIRASIKNAGSSVAFGVRVTPVRSGDKERILPVMMNDNYFTLLKGETRDIEIEFDTDLLNKGNYHLRVEAYNSPSAN